MSRLSITGYMCGNVAGEKTHYPPSEDLRTWCSARVSQWLVLKGA